LEVIAPMKILLVDDSKSARYALILQLQRHGVEVDTAESAEAAFAKLKASLPDAIMMDHMMPGLNGFEALEIIREDPRTSDIPVIMCTSHEEPDFVAAAKKKGVFGILPKSAAPELLPEMLEKLHGALGMGAAPATTATRTAAGKGETQSALSEDAVIRLIDPRVEARLSKQLTPLIEDLRRDLTESILNEAQRMIDERFANELMTRRTAAPQPTMADLQAISTRLVTETVPDLIKRSLLTERAGIMETLERNLRDAQSKAAGHLNSDAAEEISLKAAAAARRESQEALDAAMAASQQSIQTLELSFKKAKGTLYGLVALAALLGMGAAGVVFYLLGGV